MKRLIFIFILLLVAIGLGFLIHKDSGYVLLSYSNWTIETSLWFALLLAVVFFFLLYWFIRILRHTRLLGHHYQRWEDSRNREKARKLTNTGLCEYAQGHWKSAEDSLVRSAKHISTPLINYLAAARAAHEQLAYERRDQYLQQAKKSTKGSDLAVGLSQAQLQIQSEQWQAALETLTQLQKYDAQHRYLLRMLQQTHHALGNWQELIKLIPTLKRKKVLDDEQLKHLEFSVYSNILDSAAINENNEALTKTWNNIAKNWRSNPDIIHHYCQHLIELGQQQTALPLIEAALKKDYHPGLVRLYGTIESSDNNKQINTAQAWLKKYPNKPELLHCLGKLAMREKLLGKAREYLEESLKVTPTPNVYHDLGAVFEALGDQQQAMNYYRQQFSS